MYTDKKNILQLAALLEAYGITKVVLCPGSRNVPIAHTLSNHPAFTCYAMTDERSAGYFALGLALNSGKPVAVCCTSGTALLNLHPAVAEAFYQKVPLIVISADRCISMYLFPNRYSVSQRLHCRECASSPAIKA